MSRITRRAILVLTAVVVLGVSFIVGQANAQRVRQKARPPVVVFPGGKQAPTTPGTGPKKEAYDLGQLTLPKDDNLKEMLDAAEDNIRAAIKATREGNLKAARDFWERACVTLQEKLIGRSQDVFVPRQRKDPDGHLAIHYVSVKQEAARLIGKLPDAGKKFYEAKYGTRRPGTSRSRARTTTTGGWPRRWLCTCTPTRGRMPLAGWPRTDWIAPIFRALHASTES